MEEGMKKSDVKTERVYIRLTKKEKEKIEKDARKEGFSSMTEYLLFLARNYKSKIVKKIKNK